MATSFSPNIAVLTPSGITVGGTGNLTVTSTAAGPLVTRSLSPKIPSEPIYAEFKAILVSSTSGNDAVGLQFTPNALPAAVIAFCGNAATGKVWGTVDGVNWNGGGTPNPGTGTGPNTYTLSGAVHFALSIYSDLDAATINFGQAPFAYTPPSGFSAWGASETLDASLASSNITIGPDGVTAYNTDTSNVWATVLSTGSKSSGNWYVEVYLYSQPSSGLIIGLGNASANLSSYAGSDGNSVGWQFGTGDEYGSWSGPGFPQTSASLDAPTAAARSGTLLYDSNGDYQPQAGSLVEAGLPSWTSGATIGVALHPTYGAFWTTDGVNWNDTGAGSGNPVSGVGGLSVPPGAVQFVIENLASGSEITLNPTGSFVFTPPVGYSPWDGGAPVVGVIPGQVGRIQRVIAAHFAEPAFGGRRPRQFKTGSASAPPAIYPASNRRRQIIAALFKDPDFAGRRQRGVAIGPVPPPPPQPIASDVLLRRLRRYASHFTEPDYPGLRVPRPWDKVYGGGTGLPAHASQVVYEALSGLIAPYRASQVVGEVLLVGKQPARASQLVGEALTQQFNPLFVRAGQIVVEALVPYFEAPVIPIYPQLAALTFDYVKRPKTSIGRGVSSSGREAQVNYWTYPQWEWDLSYDVLADAGQNVGTTASDIKTMMGFFLSVSGSFSPFYFQDPDDNAVVGQALGTGDGTTTAFTFVRTYGQDSALGNFNGTEPVGGVNQEETLNVYVGGVLQTSGYAIETGTPYGNYIQFSSPPAPDAEITADFSFWYLCRLKDDSLDYAKFMNGLWFVKKLTIFSLKN